MRACHNSEVEVKHISNFDTKVLNYINYFTDPRETDRIQTNSYLQLPILKQCRSFIRCYFFYSVFSVNKLKRRSENNSLS